VLTRELLQQRAVKLAQNAELFAGRKGTSAAERRWAAGLIAALATVEGGINLSGTDQPVPHGSAARARAANEFHVQPMNASADRGGLETCRASVQKPRRRRLCTL
jgi:hypothetical protein